MLTVTHAIREFEPTRQTVASSFDCTYIAQFVIACRLISDFTWLGSRSSIAGPSPSVARRLPSLSAIRGYCIWCSACRSQAMLCALCITFE